MFLEYMLELKKVLPEGWKLEVEFYEDSVVVKLTLQSGDYWTTLDKVFNLQDLSSETILNNFHYRILDIINKHKDKL